MGKKQKSLRGINLDEGMVMDLILDTLNLRIPVGHPSQASPSSKLSLCLHSPWIHSDCSMCLQVTLIGPIQGWNCIS